MGMLMDFYTGDAKRIVEAWKNEDSGSGRLEDKSFVTGHACLSFHLAQEDLDALVNAACTLLGRPAMTFAQCIAADLAAVPAEDPESAIHLMTHAFTELLAAVPQGQAASLCEAWMTQLPEPDAAPPRARRERALDRLRRGMLDAIFAAVLFPVFAVVWLFSPGFRKDRKRNKLARKAATQQTARSPEYTLKEATAALIATCQTARAQGTKVLYAWSV